MLFFFLLIKIRFVGGFSHMIWLSSMIMIDQWSHDPCSSWFSSDYVCNSNEYYEWTEISTICIWLALESRCSRIISTKRTSNLTKLEQDFAWHAAKSNTKVLYFMWHFSMSFRWMKILWNCSFINIRSVDQFCNYFMKWWIGMY